MKDAKRRRSGDILLTYDDNIVNCRQRKTTLQFSWWLVQVTFVGLTKSPVSESCGSKSEHQASLRSQSRTF
jgi:hypothetical protein